jgi:glycerol kinase
VPDPVDLIVAHDVGTSGVKTVLTDLRGKVLAKHIEPYPTHFPRSGWADTGAPARWPA